MTPSTADFPPFFEDEHAALAARCQEDFVARDAPELHEAEAVVPHLGEGGYLRFLASAPRVSVRALCVVREALAYRSPLADGIFAVQGLGSHPVLLAKDFEGRDALLDALVRGARVAGFALTEPEAGSDVASMKTVARREGDDWILDGEKVFISNVGIAHGFVVFANADPSAGKRGISAFWVDAQAGGLTLASIAMSVDHPLGRLTLHGCRLPRAALIGEVGQGLRLALGTLDVFRTSVGAAANGMAARALDATLARVRERRQFGQRLADFQLTQAALADMATELDAARLLVARAAWHKDTRPESRDPSPVAMAKMFATEAAQRIIDRAVQLHGGAGVALGEVPERLYREIRALRIYEGTTEIQKLIIGGALVREATA